MMSFLKKVGLFFCCLVAGLILCLFIGLHTRQGHHVLYRLITDTVKPYSVSFAEEDLYLSFPTSLVIQRLTVETPFGPCVVHGAFLGINLLKAVKRLEASSSSLSLTHHIPPELESCRIQKITLPQHFSKVCTTLQDVYFERGKSTDTLHATLRNGQQSTTLKAKIEDIVQFTLDGTIAWDSMRFERAKVTGTGRFLPEAFEISTQFASNQGRYRAVPLKDIVFHGTICVKNGASIALKGATFSLQSEMFSGAFRGDIAYTNGHLDGSIEIKNGAFPYLPHMHGQCRIQGNPFKDLSLRLTAAAKVQNRVWSFQSSGHFTNGCCLALHSGRLSNKTTKLSLKAPLYVDFSKSNIPSRGTCYLKTTDVGEVARFFGVALNGEGIATVQFFNKSEKPKASFTVQGAHLHYDAWHMGHCHFSGEIQGFTKTSLQALLKGDMSNIKSPYGNVKTCAVTLLPKKKKHEVVLDITLENSDPIHATGTLHLLEGGITIDTLQGNGLSLKKALQGSFQEGFFKASGGIGIGKRSEIYWEGYGDKKNLSLEASFHYFSIPHALCPALLRGLLVSGVVQLKGPLQCPEGNVDIFLVPKNGVHQDFCSMRTILKTKQTQCTVRAQDRWGDFIEGIFSFQGGVDFTKISIESLLNRHFTGTLQAQAWIGRFLNLFGVLPDGMLLNGRLKATLEGSGCLYTPTLSGSIHLQDGLLELDSSGTAFRNIQIQCSAQKNRLVLHSATLRDRRTGRASITGFLEILSAKKQEGHEPRAFCDLRLNLQDLLIIGQDDLDVTALGSVRLSGVFPELSLTGTLKLPHIDFLITKSSTEEIGNLRITEIGLHKERKPFQKNTLLYLPFLCAVTLPSPRVYVHGQSVDSLWNGTLKLSGGLNNPVALEGVLRLQKGYLDFCGRRLPFVRGKIAYTADAPLEPAVHLQGHKIFSDLDVFLSVVTTPSRTYFDLTSLPDHSIEDILSILLFNKLVSELSPPEMVQLLHAAAGFQGDIKSPLSFLDTMRSFSGIDTITYNAEEYANTRVIRTLTLGKYISEKIFLGVDNELDQNTTTFSVQMFLTPRTMFEAKTNGEFGISWRQRF
ncbi:MAG: translocation/assembly module TamB [Holosporales bacterium]|jgi:hypothetical protein|nr:translocation/assembly module TamB [Holosporales bacterium]